MADAATRPKSRAVYVALALTLGLMGLHNFYARRWWQGAAQLIVCIFGSLVGALLTTLWAMVEAAAVTHDGDGVLLYVRPLAPRKRRIYVLLALFLGMTGAHSFYAYYWERGILQASLTLFGLGCEPLLTLLMVDPQSTAFFLLPKLPWVVLLWAWAEAALVRSDARGQDFLSPPYVDITL
ncbi:MAG: TM2 domain-containing protein [Verrucomicrobium sp.]|nr:TM2 domain-containing protein [Verrucomicrobium sp.]